MEEQAVAFAMSSHKRLGRDSPVRLPPELMCRIMSMVEVIVPDQVATIANAIRLRDGHSPHHAPLRIYLQPGEHIAGATSFDPHAIRGTQPGSTVLPVPNRKLVVTGHPASLVRGELVATSGSQVHLHGLRLIDAGNCCVRMHGGEWSLTQCSLICGHASAVRCEGNARVDIDGGSIGGEGKLGPQVTISAYGAIQEYGLCKNVCYALVVTDRADVRVRNATLQWCSVSAVFMKDLSTVALDACAIENCKSALFSGLDRGKELRVRACAVRGVQALWGDLDRPHECVWDEATVVHESPEPL